MTETGNIRKSIKNLCNTHLIAIGMFNTKITSSKCTLQSVFDGSRLNNLINICVLVELMTLHKTKKELTTEKAPNQVTNQAVFVGSTAELQKLLKSKR